MRKILFLILGLVIFFLSVFWCWVKIGNGVLFYVKGNDKSGLMLSSQRNLFQYLVELEKNEKAPLLLLIDFKEHPPKNFKVYRRYEPVGNSPIVIGCSWKKNYAFWKLDIFVNRELMSKLDNKMINYTIGTTDGRAGSAKHPSTASVCGQPGREVRS